MSCGDVLRVGVFCRPFLKGRAEADGVVVEGVGADEVVQGVFVVFVDGEARVVVVAGVRDGAMTGDGCVVGEGVYCV